MAQVDIDGGPELEIVEAIARNPKLSSLVDEIFFECLAALEFEGSRRQSASPVLPPSRTLMASLPNGLTLERQAN